MCTNANPTQPTRTKRARGTALISPEDLLDACKLLESLHLGMRLRRFPSGVNVVEAGKQASAGVGSVGGGRWETRLSVSLSVRLPIGRLTDWLTD